MRTAPSRGADRVLGLVLAVVVGTLAGCGVGNRPADATGSDATPSPSVSVADADYAARLAKGINDARRDEALDPLAHDDCAATVAATRADELVGTAELEHRPLDDALEQCDVELAAENLSRTSEPPEDVVGAWLASAGHAENIRNPRFDRAAVSCAEDGEERGAPRMVCVQVFLAE